MRTSEVAIALRDALKAGSSLSGAHKESTNSVLRDMLIFVRVPVFRVSFDLLAKIKKRLYGSTVTRYHRNVKY